MRKQGGKNIHAANFSPPQSENYFVICTHLEAGLVTFFGVAAFAIFANAPP